MLANSAKNSVLEESQNSDIPNCAVCLISTLVDCVVPEQSPLPAPSAVAID